MSVTAMEQALVDRLKLAFPKANVDAFPDDFKDYESLNLNRGAAILVAYRASTFSEPEALGLVVQQQLAQFEVQVITASLRGQQGATALLDAIRQLLTGASLAGSEPIRPVREEFVDHPRGRWVYASLFSCSLPHVEARATDGGPLYTEAFFANNTVGDAWHLNLATGASTEVST